MGKLVDIDGLSRYHENLKTNVLSTKQDAISDLETIRTGAAAGAAAAADATSKANAAAADAKTYADGLVKDSEGNSLFDAAGAAATAEDNAKGYADDLVKNEDGSVKFDDKGAAAAAQAAAEQKATDLDAAMNERVVKLEEIDHEKLALEASASAVAAIVAGADSDFDTLKEVADWIKNDDTGAAALQIKVSEHTDSIETINSDIDTLETNKQDVISDLETIRSGAAAGATALQADDLEYVTNGDIDGLFA